MEYECYYCTFESDDKKKYEIHVVSSHTKKLCYPGKIDLSLGNIKPKGKKWEI